MNKSGQILPYVGCRGESYAVKHVREHALLGQTHIQICPQQRFQCYILHYACQLFFGCLVMFSSIVRIPNVELTRQVY